MANNGDNQFSRAVILDGIRTERELSAIIVSIVDAIIAEDKYCLEELAKWRGMAGTDLDKVAYMAEVRIRLEEIGRMKKSILRILKKSTNKMIVASLELRFSGGATIGQSIERNN